MGDVVGYTFARFFIERMRIDTANKILGLRVNEWVSALIFLGTLAFLIIDWWRHRHDQPVTETDEAGSDEQPDGAPSADTDDDTADDADDVAESTESEPADGESIIGP